jgi:sulfate adenylyltransferase subunit 1
MQPVNDTLGAPAQSACTPLTFITCGSVDDGKSTLIGRLLYDSRALLADQVQSIASASFAGTAAEGLDLSRATDGLEAEREQGITIDVAWRYFATPRRKFVIADTPGHAQYTRNMVTGASHAQAAVLLIDVTKLDFVAAELVLLEQTRRHAALVRLLGIPQVLVAVNKMDAVGFDRALFARVRDAFAGLADALGLAAWQAFPVSALTGEGVTRPGERLGWFDGPTLLEALEALEALPVKTGDRADDDRQREAWLPVHWTLRASDPEGARWVCGRLDQGTLSVGDALQVLPAATRAMIVAMRVAGRPAERARAGEAVALRLDAHMDVGRGDWLTTAAAPVLGEHFGATLAWLDPAPLVPGRACLLRHGTRWVRARVERVSARLDLAQAAWDTAAAGIGPNDIAAVTVELAEAIPLDTHVETARGRFLLVDPHTHATLAAGVLAQPFGETLASAARLAREWAG